MCSSDLGTFLEGEQIRRCRPLHDGDEIKLGRQGPVLVFTLAEEPGTLSPKRREQPPQNIVINGTSLPVNQVLSTVVRSEPLYPHIFSWWLLTSVAGLLLLPFPAVFWPLELAALGGWILLGSRKNHTLIVVQRDGNAQRRAFANRVTALAHRNGIRQAIGQSLQGP